jgi:NADH-quinone oxidoreductase subunit F
MHPKERRIILRYADEPTYSNRIESYLGVGGYETLKKALAMEPGAIIEEVKKSGLRGRGGAGFSCGLKWSLVDRKSGKPIYLICNADESEPGTFKDRQILHKDPHQMLEGIIISAYANGVKTAYVYIRGEFPQGAKIIERAIDEARAKGFVGRNIGGKQGFDLEIYVHRGGGAYICGEETGLIESLEGKRAYPRFKPPYFPAVLGLYMCPTIVNNVETLCNVVHVVSMGSVEYSKIGTPNNTGTRIVCVSGHVNRPGYYEIETGKVTFGELINDFCGGLKNGRKLKAIIPGGSSSKILRADEKFKIKRKKPDGSEEQVEIGLLDIPYDFDTVTACGTMSGSGAVIVLDETTDMVEALHNISAFYAHESCGQCTPCREGSLWMESTLGRLTEGEGRKSDVDLLKTIADNIAGRTICPFGEACAWPVQSFVIKFRDEFLSKAASEEKARDGRPPKPAVRHFHGAQTLEVRP